MPSTVTVERLCGECEQKFPTREQLEEHMQAVHARLCPHCGLASVRYEEHLRTQHMCLACGFYGPAGVLEAHRRSHVFPCTDCGQEFESRAAAEEHEKSTHEAECRECGDEFSWPEVGHSCHFTRRQLPAPSGRVIRQGLYRGYFYCTEPVLDRALAALGEPEEVVRISARAAL
jgi:predicted RNA-binding Zn-ribbon protein involved in translation (DUF1610 family)